MKTVLSLLLIFAATPALATYLNVDGSWQGKGSVTHNRAVINCAEIKYQFSHTQTEIFYTASFDKCENGMQLEIEVDPVQIKNGKLYYGNKAIGHMTADRILIKFNEKGFSYDGQILKTAKGIKFSESISERDGDVYGTTASLTLVKQP